MCTPGCSPFNFTVSCPTCGFEKLKSPSLSRWFGQQTDPTAGRCIARNMQTKWNATTVDALKKGVDNFLDTAVKAKVPNYWTNGAYLILVNFRDKLVSVEPHRLPAASIAWELVSTVTASDT